MISENLEGGAIGTMYTENMIAISPCFGSCLYAGERTPGSLDVYLPAPVFIGYLKLAPFNKTVSDFVSHEQNTEDAFPFCRPESSKKLNDFSPSANLIIWDLKRFDLH